MKNLVLLEISLLSQRERKAKKIEFHPTRTLVKGNNSTGKSSLLKSIVRTFGADPTVLPNQWDQADVSSLVKFRINEDVFYLLKNNKVYALFDNNLRTLKIFEGVTKGLSEYLASLLEFRLKLVDKNNKLTTPPPSCYFLPFYIDQDVSWLKSWDAFKGLGQFPRIKESLAKYHTGIRPNEYYETKGEIDSLRIELKMQDDEIKTLKGVLKNLNEKLNQATFNVNIEDFKVEVEELLVECDQLKNIEDEIKNKLAKYYSLKIALESQIKITDNSLIEFKRDFKYAVEELEEEIECPTCGVPHKNSFAERFAIAQDEQRCYELLNDLREELMETNNRIEQETNRLKSNNEELAKIEEILQRKQGEVKLKDIIESEGKREVKKLFDNELDNIQILKLKRTRILSQLEEKLRKLENSDRKEKILSLYKSSMTKYLEILDLDTVPESTYRRIDYSTNENGSRRPRALIAYYYSILQVMREYSSSVFAPIIIDSPNQQDQDKDNLTRILSFIRDYQPKDSQLILALADTHGIDFNCPIIDLNDKESLLNESYYDEVFEIMNPLIQTSYTGQGRLF